MGPAMAVPYVPASMEGQGINCMRVWVYSDPCSDHGKGVALLSDKLMVPVQDSGFRCKCFKVNIYICHVEVPQNGCPQTTGFFSPLFWRITAKMEKSRWLAFLGALSFTWR